MKKQDNENLIQELTSHLDWYMTEASEEEFDVEKVQAMMKLLDSLKSDEKEKIEEKLPVEEAVGDFWKYCEAREEEERLLLGAEESSESDSTSGSKKAEEQKDSKFHRLLLAFHRHRLVAVAAVVLAVILLGGSWQVVANAEKHGGFFWWMDKSEEGTTMITSPEGSGVLDGVEGEKYYSVDKVPEEYREYVEKIFKIDNVSEYKLNYVKIIKGSYKDNIYVFFKNDDKFLRFEIIAYPKEMLRLRETYLAYSFEEEFENEGITFSILSKKEYSGETTYLMCFYYNKAKYIIIGNNDKEYMQNIVIEYKNLVTNYEKKEQNN